MDELETYDWSDDEEQCYLIYLAYFAQVLVDASQQRLDAHDCTDDERAPVGVTVH
jgi:hypothetical protein